MVRLPLRRAYETSGSVETHQTHVLVRAESEGVVGWGESVAPELPWYSGETPRTIWYALTEIMVPRLLGLDLAGAAQVERELEWIREHRMAKASIEMAAWDLEAKQAGVPLSRLLGGTRERILCGVAIGLQPTVPALLARIEEELRGGYQRVKLKIKPGRDIEIAEAVRGRFPDLSFMLDANSAYSLADAEVFRRIDASRPTMIEQPLAHDDIVDHAALQRRIATPICLDESIHSGENARKAIEIGATKVINIKAGRVGGLAGAKRIHDVCLARGIPVWCGGMLESGIGRLANVHLQTLPGFTLPGDTSASARYFAEDLIDPPVTVAADGTVAVPEGPGIGHEIVWPRVERATVAREVWTP